MASANDANDFTRRIRQIPKLMEELRDVAPLIERMAAPLDEASVTEALAPAVILYGTPDFGHDRELASAMTKAWRTTYAKALRNVPREALDHAVSEFILRGHPTNPRLSGKMPTPDVLFALAKPKAEEIHMIAYRVRQALKSVQQEKPAPTESEKAEVREFLANLRAGKSLGEAVMSSRPREGQAAMAERLRASAGA